jgi:hypothetical protein
MKKKALIIIIVAFFNHHTYASENKGPNILSPLTVSRLLSFLNDVQKLPTALKIYSANTFLKPSQECIIIKQSVPYTQEERINKEPFMLYSIKYSDTKEKELYHITLEKDNELLKQKKNLIITKESPHYYVELIGPNKNGFFILNSSIKFISDANIEYPLPQASNRKTIPEQFSPITALFPQKNNALTLTCDGDIYKHTWNNNGVFNTEQLPYKLSTIAEREEVVRQAFITLNGTLIARTDQILYILAPDHQSHKEIMLDTLFPLKKAQETLWKENIENKVACTKFLHVEYCKKQPHYLLIEIYIGDAPVDRLKKRKYILYDMNQSLVFDVPLIENFLLPLRWSGEEAISRKRKLHTETCAPKPETKNERHIIAMIPPEKTKVMLEAYLILTAAQLWNSKETKSKEEASALISHLKRCRYAGSLYAKVSNDFKDIFDKMLRLIGVEPNKKYYL